MNLAKYKRLRKIKKLKGSVKNELFNEVNDFIEKTFIGLENLTNKNIDKPWSIHDTFYGKDFNNLIFTSDSRNEMIWIDEQIWNWFKLRGIIDKDISDILEYILHQNYNLDNYEINVYLQGGQPLDFDPDVDEF